MTAVAVFAKAPIPGRVKTRLAADVGEERALALYRWVGRRVVDALGASYQPTVWYDPPGAVGLMHEWLGDRTFVAQPQGDLGARLAHAVAWHVTRGDAPVVVVGADVPGLGSRQVAAACDALEHADVVLGPATDGGYYLVAMRRLERAVFEGIPWGGPRVMDVTLAVCNGAHLAVRTLAPLRDLDRAADLDALGICVP